MRNPEQNSNYQKNFGDFKILAAGRTNRFFASGAEIGSYEKQTIPIPDRGQSNAFIALSPFIVGTTADSFSVRVESKSKTSFILNARSANRFSTSAGILLYVDYIVIGI